MRAAAALAVLWFGCAPKPPPRAPDMEEPQVPTVPSAEHPQPAPTTAHEITPVPTDGGSHASEPVTWSCTGKPCPWGQTIHEHALVWPSATGATIARLGYTASAGIYLPAAAANGLEIAVHEGKATAYAGLPNTAEHRRLGTLGAGTSLPIRGLSADEVLSVQSETHFTYSLGKVDPNAKSSGQLFVATQSVWRCNAPTCKAKDWRGAVVSWPSWAAYHDNARDGNDARAVFGTTGEPLYPYMGLWADGCEVTAETGIVLIIEWKRGADVWRETRLDPGMKHVIRLRSPEDGAMIETLDDLPSFSVTLDHCTPQRLPGR
ncbi:MAG TPA: hypothetical protein VGK73_17725 [Polyangiaceae bacterium]